MGTPGDAASLLYRFDNERGGGFFMFYHSVDLVTCVEVWLPNSEGFGNGLRRARKLMEAYEALVDTKNIFPSNGQTSIDECCQNYIYIYIYRDRVACCCKLSGHLASYIQQRAGKL